MIQLWLRLISVITESPVQWLTFQTEPQMGTGSSQFCSRANAFNIAFLEHRTWLALPCSFACLSVGPHRMLSLSSAWLKSTQSPFNSVQLVAQSCPTLCNPMDGSTPGLPIHHNSQSLTKLMSVMPSNLLILFHPLLLLPSIFPNIRVFSNELALPIRWPKYWSFSFSISPSNEHPGLICFRMDWLDLLAVQGALKSLLQHHSSKALIFRHPAFFIVQLSHPYMTTGKTIALTRWTFFGKIMSAF